MTVEVPDAIDDLPLLCADLIRPEIVLNSDIVVAREHPQRDPLPQSFQDTGQLKIFLSRECRDAVLDIAKEDKPVRIHAVDERKQPLQPGPAPAPEMKPVECK